MRGQAAVEFAILLPVMLTLLVGSLISGLAIIERIELQHVVQQAATHGAGAPEPCVAALEAVQRLSGPPGASCELIDDIITVSAIGAEYSIPFLPTVLIVEADASAIIEEVLP